MNQKIVKEIRHDNLFEKNFLLLLDSIIEACFELKIPEKKRISFWRVTLTRIKEDPNNLFKLNFKEKLNETLEVIKKEYRAGVCNLKEIEIENSNFNEIIQFVMFKTQEEYNKKEPVIREPILFPEVTKDMDFDSKIFLEIIYLRERLLIIQKGNDKELLAIKRYRVLFGDKFADKYCQEVLEIHTIHKNKVEREIAHREKLLNNTQQIIIKNAEAKDELPVVSHDRITWTGTAPQLGYLLKELQIKGFLPKSTSLAGLMKNNFIDTEGNGIKNPHQVISSIKNPIKNKRGVIKKPVLDEIVDETSKK